MSDGTPDRGPHLHNSPPPAVPPPAGGPSTAAGSAPDAEPVPETVGRFVVVGEIARGGMGVVYRARDPGLNREVAVKLVRGVYRRSPAAVRRFTDEATITGQLQHPGIPPVHEVGRLPDGSPFLAMKLIKGQTLEALLKDGGGDRPPNRIAIFEQICQAVGYAHAHQVIHRDLKPANVMVGAFGEVQVMDWGLAKVMTLSREPQPSGPTDATLGTEIQTLRGDAAATQAGSLLGTPAFMPPEQATGMIDEIDTRSDVFGLGAILCVILTGRPPYVGPDAEAIRKLAVRGKLDDAFARLAKCGAEPELVGLCKWCLAAEKADRPADAGELAKAVAALRADAERRARLAELDRAKAEVRAAEQRKRWKVQAALAVTAMLLLAGGGGTAWWVDHQTTERRSEQVRQEAERVSQEREVRRSAAAGMALAVEFRQQYRFREADSVLEQAAGQLAGGLAEDLRPEVELAREDVRFARRLDEILLLALAWKVEGWYQSSTREESIPQAYRAAFRTRGYDVDAAEPGVLATRIRESAIRQELLDALDYWSLYESDPAALDRLLGLARAADPGPWKDQLRSTAARGDAALLRRLAADIDPAVHSPAPITVLVKLMQKQNKLDPTTRDPVHFNPTALLAKALDRHPTNFRIAYAYGDSLYFKNGALDRDLQLASLRIARALRPEVSEIPRRMALLLCFGQDDEQTFALREALRLDPTDTNLRAALVAKLHAVGDADGTRSVARAGVHADPENAAAYQILTDILRKTGDTDGAVRAGRDAVRLDPDGFWSHLFLWEALGANGDPGGAGVELREAARCIARDGKTWTACIGTLHRYRGNESRLEAVVRDVIRVNPDYPPAFAELASLLETKRDWDGALSAARAAVRLGSQDARAHNQVGRISERQMDFTGAVPAYREALRLDPKLYEAYVGLGNCLRRTGDVAGAIAVYQEAVRRKMTGVGVYQNLAALLSDRGDPGSALALLRDGARMYPAWMTDYSLGIRYDSACYACLSAAGHDKDLPPAAVRPGLRREALAWLTDDLKTWQERAADPTAKRTVRQTMQHWLADPDFVSVRHPMAVAFLPAAERAGWAKLWADVRRLRDETAPPRPATP